MRYISIALNLILGGMWAYLLFNKLSPGLATYSFLLVVGAAISIPVFLVPLSFFCATAKWKGNPYGI